MWTCHAWSILIAAPPFQAPFLPTMINTYSGHSGTIRVESVSLPCESMLRVHSGHAATLGYFNALSKPSHFALALVSISKTVPDPFSKRIGPAVAGNLAGSNGLKTTK
jgi:hypothetical protein